MHGKILYVHYKYRNLLAKDVFKLGYWFFEFFRSSDDPYIRILKITDNGLDSVSYRRFLNKYNLESCKL